MVDQLYVETYIRRQSIKIDEVLTVMNYLNECLISLMRFLLLLNRSYLYFTLIILTKIEEEIRFSFHDPYLFEFKFLR